MESRFFEPPRETKIGSKNRIVLEVGGKITEKKTFGSNYRKVRKNEDSRNRDFTVVESFVEFVANNGSGSVSCVMINLIFMQTVFFGYVADEDVLDTWFSSGLFPFSIFGWPEEVSYLIVVKS